MPTATPSRNRRSSVIACAATRTTRLFRIRPFEPQSQPRRGRVWLSPRLGGLQRQQVFARRDHARAHRPRSGSALGTRARSIRAGAATRSKPNPAGSNTSAVCSRDAVSSSRNACSPSSARARSRPSRSRRRGGRRRRGRRRSGPRRRARSAADGRARPRGPCAPPPVAAPHTQGPARRTPARPRRRRRPRAGSRRSRAGAAPGVVGSSCGGHGSGDHSVPCTRWNAMPANGWPGGAGIRGVQSNCHRHSSRVVGIPSNCHTGRLPLTTYLP